MRKWIAALCIAAVCSCSKTNDTDIILETSTFRLVMGQDATAKSLVLKGSRQEMLSSRDKVPMFTVTQERPFNNEIKLEKPNTRTTFRADRVRKEDDRLIVGFETAAYEAAIKVSEGPGYLVFELEDFICDHQRDYEGLKMNVPPVAEMRLLQLPVRERDNFGEWLNAMWDDKTAVCVAGCDPYTEIWHTDTQDGRLMTADLYSGIRLRGGKVAIIAAQGKENFLDVMDGFEKDLDLPRGVQSRRSPLLNRSIYWVSDATPENIDRHIGYAKKAGMEMMLFYYTCFTGARGFAQLGDYDLKPEYPDGLDDIREMIAKVKAAGIPMFGFDTEVADLSYLVTYAGSDNYNAGYVCGLDLVEKLPEGGPIIVLLLLSHIGSWHGIAQYLAGLVMLLLAALDLLFAAETILKLFGAQQPYRYDVICKTRCVSVPPSGK